MADLILKRFPEEYNDLPEASEPEYFFTTRKGDKKPFRVDKVRLAKEIGIDFIGARPIEFEGLVLPNLNNEGDPLQKGDWTFLGAGETYTNVNGGQNIETPSDKWSIGWFDENVWQLKVMGTLPIQDLSDYVTKEEFDPVSQSVLDYNQPIGVTDDLSTYSLQNTGEYTRVNKTLIPKDGTIKELQVRCFRAGQLKLSVFKQEGTTNYMTVRSQVTVNAIIGLNTFAVDLEAKQGDYFGVSQPTGQALLYSKSKLSSGLGSTSNNPSVGDTIGFNINSDAEFAIKGILEVEGFASKIPVFEERIDSIEERMLEVSDMEISETSNLAKPQYIYSDMYIASAGQKVKGTPASLGWKVIRIPVFGLDFITFGNFTITGGGYSSFYGEFENPNDQGNANLVQYNGAFTNTIDPITLAVPVNAHYLYIDIARPSNFPSDYANLMINEGQDLLPYEDPTQYLIGLKGFLIKSSGGSSNVSKFSDLTDVPSYTGNAGKALKINDTEDGVDVFNPVEQNTDVNFNTVTALAVVVENVPVWDETGIPPVAIGQEYIFSDGSSQGFKKIRLI